MKKNMTFVCVGLFALALFIVIWSFYRDGKQDLSHETILTANQNLQNLADHNRKRLSSALTETLEFSEIKKGISQELLEIQTTFKVLHEHRDFFNIEKLREEIFAELSHKKALISKVESTLSDHSKAVEWFAEDQAIIRVLGIQFLSYLHRNGIEEPLKNSIHGILGHLKNSVDETYKGQFLDAEDLIMHLSSNLGKQAIGVVPTPSLENLIETLIEEFKIDELEFESESARELVVSVGKGMALGLRGKYSLEEISKILIRHFPKSFS